MIAVKERESGPSGDPSRSALETCPGANAMDRHRRSRAKPRQARSSAHAADATPERPSDGGGRSLISERRDLLYAAALLVAVVLAYQPAWNGGFIWDDDAHVTRSDLQSWDGLRRIWSDLDATQQYYPLLHTAFWVQHRCWGDAPFGYHLVNIVLHASVAFLAAMVLRRLEIPGAYLAGAIFALHPVHVETVAWITELKNTLSGVFYLTAALAYLRFDQTRHRPWYLLALGLFVLGLLSKTVIATLPAALLVVFWWNRGRLSWRRDALPLVPFFVLGAIGGLFTAWVEKTLIGAEGEVFEFTFLQRSVIAGSVIWFYFAKLLWPAKLMFVYPRWDISHVEWWQILIPISVLLVLAGLWWFRRRMRGPLAGALFFVGTLFPVLGFFNVYPFRYSFVADHFQYLPSLGIITLVSAGIVLLLRRWQVSGRPAVYAACLVMLAVLATLTWRQSRLYADVETLYRTTIERNPTCWMAYDNLGILLADRGELEEAVVQLEKAVEIKPDHGEAHSNLAIALQMLNRLDEAAIHASRAAELQPKLAEVHFNLANVLKSQRRIEEAIASYQRALSINPRYTKCHINLGIALLGLDRNDEAAAAFENALAIEPDHFGARQNLGVALFRQGKHREALACWREVLRLMPDQVSILNLAAQILAGSHDPSVINPAEAVALAERAVQLTRFSDPVCLDTLAAAYAAAGRFPDAVQMATVAQQKAADLGNDTLAEAIQKKREYYQQGRTPGDDASR